MDTRSRNVVVFLDALGREMRRLAQEVKSHYAYRRSGRTPRMPVLALASRGLVLALPVKGADGAEYELAVDVTWDSEHWRITTGIYRDADRGGQETLRMLPDRSASDLEACLEHVHAAISDLTKFVDLIP